MENREIRFRVWNGKEMVYPAIIGLPPYENFAWCHSRSWLHNCQDWSGEDGYIESPILMQYTGIKDKHGKEIFDQDIIQHNDNKLIIMWSENRGWVAKVIGDKVNWRDYNWIYNCQKYITMIGNSHQNPELCQ